MGRAQSAVAYPRIQLPSDICRARRAADTELVAAAVHRRENRLAEHRGAAYPAKFMVALATGNKMRSRPGSTPNGLLLSVPAYSRFPDGLVGVPARKQIVYCLILTREREP
jgi:hypothetical protein